jgi:phage terminase large subunit
MLQTKSSIRRQIRYTPVFTANKAAYFAKRRYISNQGSSRSSKSYSIMQLLTLIGQKEPHTSISVVSPSLPHLKRGAMRDFMGILGDGVDAFGRVNGQGLYQVSRHNKTDNIYDFGKGSYMEFFGAENEGKVRGPGRKILFVNEANLISFELFTQLALRTTGTIFIDFNPADLNSWVYDIGLRDNAQFIHSTYKNNLGNLPAHQIAEIEYLREADANLWRVYGLGLKGASSETIYTTWMIIKQMPEQLDSESYGLDFGFNHPSVLMRVGVKDGRCYADELLYESGLTHAQLAMKLKEMGMDKGQIIWCDHASPAGIRELRLAGIDAREALKDVYDGILTVKSRPLYVTERSTNTIKELKSYKWKKTKEGVVLDEPVKFMDDAMDALRYAIFSVYQRFKRKTAIA